MCIEYTNKDAAWPVYLYGRWAVAYVFHDAQNSNIVIDGLVSSIMV
jgi:hypothetical protein